MTGVFVDLAWIVLVGSFATGFMDLCGMLRKWLLAEPGVDWALVGACWAVPICFGRS